MKNLTPEEIKRLKNDPTVQSVTISSELLNDLIPQIVRMLSDHKDVKNPQMAGAILRVAADAFDEAMGVKQLFVEKIDNPLVGKMGNA